MNTETGADFDDTRKQLIRAAALEAATNLKCETVAELLSTANTIEAYLTVGMGE
jgi:hypothetical protein